MGAIYEYIDAFYDQNPDVNMVAAKVHLISGFLQILKGKRI
jgi:hypothetical protein